MPTARELLEQADALMRRNRSGDSGIPLLTDAVPEESAIVPRTGPPTRERAPMSRGQTAEARAPRDWALRDDANRAPESSGIDDVTGAAVTELEGEPAVPPASAAPAVTRTLRAAGSEPTPPPTGSTPRGDTEGSAASTGESGPAAATNDDERWRALAEQISMQVLQRLDLFIDTGLKAQLASHLQPIVARAGAELVETINAHVGQLVRTYVAEAIEREIAQWRKQQE